jgi:hypothetical protein
LLHALEFHSKDYLISQSGQTKKTFVASSSTQSQKACLESFPKSLVILCPIKHLAIKIMHISFTNLHSKKKYLMEG